MIRNFKLEQDGPDKELYKVTMKMDLIDTGAFIDRKIIFDYRTIKNNLRGDDISSSTVFPESRKIRLVNIKRKQRNIDELEAKEAEFGIRYPHGHITDYTVEPDGIKVELKMLNMYGNESKNIISLMKHNMVSVLPIIKRGRMVGLAVALETPTGFEL